jgi:hypothetical protein
MTDFKEGDTILLFPPCSQNPEFIPWMGREATIIQQNTESRWCEIQVKGGVAMNAPVKWFRKKD